MLAQLSSASLHLPGQPGSPLSPLRLPICLLLRHLGSGLPQFFLQWVNCTAEYRKAKYAGEDNL